MLFDGAPDAEEGPGEVGFDMSDGFLLGIGGGPGLRKTCGLFDGSGGGGVEAVKLEARYGSVGSERADALEMLRLTSMDVSRAPSEVAT